MNIVDTTLRDGEQKAGVAFNVCDKVKIAKLLDYIGVAQIEAGTPSMGGVERKSIEKIVELHLQARISAWNRMNHLDIQASIECGVDIIHISIPASDLHIYYKFNQTRQWVMEQMESCIDYARERNLEVHIGLEDASRADIDFILEICRKAQKAGASRIRYADTVGILTPSKVYQDIQTICEHIEVPVGIHAHNDFGMAVANSLASVRAGVTFVDTTIGGFGERSGNCNLLHMLKAAIVQGQGTKKEEASLQKLLKVQDEILRIFHNHSSNSFNTVAFA
ncbi:homocitrate synthase [Desulfuribacillus stibiiarsenatis]|uniref:Homocitrate synthase n=1 Tax=Desulfuribacillus stibiiarsenatis TaxID=1390249 RepID=A0A1E5L3C1_9FIRM|nr:homocitrate synthase [Desulfuribacillus stibiiarsenatis]OEH84645.1 homocitrate synthase [Desulfuribacillus stibiiarsenatis]